MTNHTLRFGENVNPFNVFTYTGDIELYPESDNWVDTTSLNPIQGPVVEGNFLTTVREFNADQNGFSLYSGTHGKLLGLEHPYH